MKKINYNGYDFEIKQEYLTGGQVTNLVTEAIKIYKNGGFLDDYAFNPVDMEINFYAGLFYLTIEDYDINSTEQFEELFSHNVHKYLLESITNAQLAYDLMWKTSREIGNSIGSLLYKISTFLDNLPEQEDLNKLMDKLPEEWKNVKEQYDDIMKIDDKNNKEGEKE